MPGQLGNGVQPWRVGNGWPLRAPHLCCALPGSRALHLALSLLCKGEEEAKNQEKQLAGHGRRLGREAADPRPSPWVWSGKLTIWRNSQGVDKDTPSLTGSSTCMCVGGWSVWHPWLMTTGDVGRHGGRAQWDWVLPSRGSP